MKGSAPRCASATAAQSCQCRIGIHQECARRWRRESAETHETDPDLASRSCTRTSMYSPTSRADTPCTSIARTPSEYVSSRYQPNVDQRPCRVNAEVISQLSLDDGLAYDLPHATAHRYPLPRGAVGNTQTDIAPRRRASEQAHFDAALHRGIEHLERSLELFRFRNLLDEHQTQDIPAAMPLEVIRSSCVCVTASPAPAARDAMTARPSA